MFSADSSLKTTLGSYTGCILQLTLQIFYPNTAQEFQHHGVSGTMLSPIRVGMWWG